MKGYFSEVQAIRQIEKNSNYVFFYDAAALDEVKRKNIDCQGTIAVSYTHIAASIISMEDVERIEREIDKLDEQLPAVSYTHLDVYKRQVFRLAGSSRI